MEKPNQMLLSAVASTKDAAISMSMDFKVGEFIAFDGLKYSGILKDLRKSIDPWRPLYEVFTNALEAIELNDSGTVLPEVKIILSKRTILAEQVEFESLEVIDNGVGFNDKEFQRFIIYKDDSKSDKNKGSGRIQLIQTFYETVYQSIFNNQNSFFERTFICSKSKRYLDNNSIVQYKELKEVSSNSTGTKVHMSGPIEKRDKEFYNNLTIKRIKDQFVSHYALLFSVKSTSLPLITIEYQLDNKLVDSESITAGDLPVVDNQFSINVGVFKPNTTFLLSDPNQAEEQISFKVTCLTSDSGTLKNNIIKLTSKGEVVQEPNVDADYLPSSKTIDGKHYLFLVSSQYLDTLDGDIRGRFKIRTKEEINKDNSFTFSDEIAFDDLKDAIKEKILTTYPFINVLIQESQKSLGELKEMFLLNEDTLKGLSISLNDTEDKILEKFYTAEAKVIAEKDAKLKHHVDSLTKLNPANRGFQDELEKVTNLVVKSIPLQNRIALTHYVARRKLILELFDRVLKKELEAQNQAGRNFDEKILHNLIFQQTSDDPTKSDLWLINEDFIYFKGKSEGMLGDIEYNGTKILRQDLTGEELEFLNSGNENRYAKRPDILLFPDEGKCIIIEFKSIEEKVADHLNKVNYYATLIYNFSTPDFKFDTFYGFLIGQNIHERDVRAYSGDYRHSYHFDFLYRNQSIANFNNPLMSGSMYSEVIKYSTLLDRAILRNKIFINKLTKNFS